MTKRQAIRVAESHGAEASFLANVIICHHEHEARKLVGLARLLNRGMDVRLGNDIDDLVIDGFHRSWRFLTDAAKPV